jgi:putative mycofactocin binding protein MftB
MTQEATTMSHDTSRTPIPDPGFDLDGAWGLHPQVAVRPEPFGALLYHFGSRRLSFVKDRAVREVVVSLAAHPSARSACRAAGLPAAPPTAVTAALTTLAETGMIERRIVASDPAFPVVGVGGAAR